MRFHAWKSAFEHEFRKNQLQQLVARFSSQLQHRQQLRQLASATCSNTYAVQGNHGDVPQHFLEIVNKTMKYV